MGSARERSPVRLCARLSFLDTTGEGALFPGVPAAGSGFVSDGSSGFILFGLGEKMASFGIC